MVPLPMHIYLRKLAHRKTAVIYAFAYAIFVVNDLKIVVPVLFEPGVIPLFLNVDTLTPQHIPLKFVYCAVHSLSPLFS